MEMPSFDSDLETITLRGEPDKLGRALTQVYEKASSVVSAEVDAPRWLHRFIIGRKGQNIRKITQDLPKVGPGDTVHVINNIITLLTCHSCSMPTRLTNRGHPFCLAYYMYMYCIFY